MEYHENEQSSFGSFFQRLELKSILILILLLMLSSFQEIRRSIYILEIQANADTVSVNVPENVTGDVAGNKNLPSNVLQVKHCNDSSLLVYD